MWKMFKVNSNINNNVIDVVLVSLFLTLNIFHIFFKCYHCWRWTGIWLLDNHVHLVKKLNSRFRPTKLLLRQSKTLQIPISYCSLCFRGYPWHVLNHCRFGHIYWKKSLMENLIFCKVFLKCIISSSRLFSSWCEAFNTTHHRNQVKINPHNFKMMVHTNTKMVIERSNLIKKVD